jgi:tetratricopeptide (TPR) repeat protein
MSSGESAEVWLEKGAEAYAKMRMAEAAQDFEKAVAADSHSARAHLCLGVIYLFQYQNGVAQLPDPSSYAGEDRSLTREGYQARAEARRAQIAEQNATNRVRSEEHLTRTLELEPRYELAMEYLAALYSWWRDPPTESFARLDEAKQTYERLLQINPQHRFANYASGVIDWQKGMRIVRADTGFPRPLVDEESRRSLNAKAAPVLANTARNLLRSLELEPNNTDAMTYLMFVRRDQSYIAETDDDAVRANTEADDWRRKLDEIRAASAKAAGRPWPPPPDQRATMTLTLTSPAKKPAIPSFPPDSRWMIPPAPPPPPTLR